MADTILQTRLLSKIDTLERWNSSNLKIKQGEICLATAVKDIGNNQTEPVIMLKIGNENEDIFKNLPWSFYARASDVLECCKDEDDLKTFVNGLITAAISSSGLVSDSTLTEKLGKIYTKTEIDNKMEELISWGDF